jgi:hypothetical protein
MKAILIPLVLAAATALYGQHGEPPSDNKALEGFLGSWTGTAAQLGSNPAPATAKGSKYLDARFIKVDLTFEGEHGKLEAVALMTTSPDGAISGYFFASMSTQPIVASGTVVGKKVIFTGRPLQGDETVTLTFDFSVADEFSFTLSESDSSEETMSGKFKRKKEDKP